MSKLWLFKSLIFSSLVVLLAWDALLILTKHYAGFPEPHLQLLMTGLLLWLVALLTDRNRDDDWAGQL